MKKYKNPIPDGGAPLHNNRLTTELNDEIWSAIESVVAGVSSACIVSGCAVTGAGPHDIAAGIMFVDGAFLRFGGASGVVLPQYISKGALTDVNKVFADGASKALLTTQDAVISGVDPGGTRLVISDANPDTLLKLLATNQVAKTGDSMTGALTNSSSGTFEGGVQTDSTANGGKVLKKKVIEIGPWDMDATNSVTINHGLTTGRQIRSIKVIVRNDTGDNAFDLLNSDGTTINGYIGAIIGTVSFNLWRTLGGYFDVAGFSNVAGSYNRGWVTIEYDPDITGLAS